MRAKLLLIPALLMSLSACSDPATYHVGDAERLAMAPLPPQPKAFADASFCQHAAAQDASQDFDANSRTHLYRALYSQCLIAFGPPALRLADLENDTYSY